MAYNYITNKTSRNQTTGRGGSKITEIVIHHWGDPAQKPKFDAIVNYLCVNNNQVSANYVATGNGRKVAHIVSNANTAWHAGNWAVNQRSIGIECDPQATAADYDVVAELIASIWKAYGKLPLNPHKKYINTACPGRYDLNKLKKLAEGKLVSSSKYATQAEIEKAYKDLLGRKPDAGGLKTYLNAKMTITQVRAAIQKSAEYKNRQARLKAEEARKKAEEAKKKATEASAAEKAKLEAEAKKKAEEAAKLEQENRDKAAAEREKFLNEENNGLLKQILAILKKVFNIS